MTSDPSVIEPTAPSANELGSFAEVYPDGIEKHYWSDARNRIIRRLVRSHADLSSPVLEIGCARGVVCGYLRDQGIDCWGVDLEPSKSMGSDLAQYIQTGVDVLEMEESWLAQFPTVLMFDVLEHIENPVEFLQQLFARSPGIKKLIITLPARMEIWSNFDENYGHFLRYDRGSLQELADDSGLQISDWGYAFRPMLAAAMVLNKLGMNRSTTITPPLPVMRPVHSAMAWSLSVESQLVPRSIPGSSIYAVLTPQSA